MAAVQQRRRYRRSGSTPPGRTDLRWLLRRAGLILHFQPEEWQLDDAATASAEDCARALSRMARADHWNEGAFARCFEEPDSVGRAVLRRALELKKMITRVA
ncbi:hypothetical protein [Rhodococcus sp. AH-ZY2]|uniref:hypothetical protein n=1 Tax=Rhodococcus TaxID=1827 RepID=UPI0027E0EE21|nr:hypothetical protein [Rhodococcus sp. AH-ZY2]WML60920.1 hypothetical protein QNA09_00795 [Rhodococcus sp. AH-ZY2]